MLGRASQGLNERAQSVHLRAEGRLLPDGCRASAASPTSSAAGHGALRASGPAVRRWMARSTDPYRARLLRFEHARYGESAATPRTFLLSPGSSVGPGGGR